MGARGIVLISTLVLVSLTVMVLGAAFLLMPGSSSLASDTRAQALALEAAETGLAYAQARFQSEDPGWDWVGSASDQVRIVDRPELTVVEDHGNVVGIIQTADGSTSEFLIRFNLQDGSNDPDSVHFLETPHISANNLKGYGPLPVPQAGFACQPQEAVLLVEGRAGDGLRGATVDDPYPFGGNQRVISRLVECHYRKKKHASDLSPGALFAGAGLDLKIEEPYDATRKKDADRGGIELNTASEAAPEVFVNGNVYATDQAGTTDQVIATNARAPQGVINAKKAVLNSAAPINTKFNNGASMPGFPQLDWEALEVPPTSETIRAGIYMWRGNGKAKSLYYYDAKYEDYQAGLWTPPPAAPADSVNDSALRTTLGSGFTKNLLETDAGELTIRTDLTVTASASSNSLAIVAEGTSFGEQDSLGQLFTFEPPKGQMLYLNNGLGNLYLEGKVDGNKGASLISAGNLSLAGGGSDVNAYGVVQDVPVNLYSRGKISIKTKKGDGKYDPLSLRGLVYAWGDVDLDAGKKPVRVRGSMVAYGTDVTSKPSRSNAGSATVNGKGMVSIRAGMLRLNYDDAVNAGLQTGANRGPVERCFWVSY